MTSARTGPGRPMRAHGQAPKHRCCRTVVRLIRSPPPAPPLRMRRRRGAPRPRHPALTQDAVQAQLLVALAAVGHVPGHGDVHRQVPGAVHGLGAPPPGDPRAAGCVGGSGQLDGLHLLDALGHAVVAQVVAQQGQAFLCEGEPETERLGPHRLGVLHESPLPREQAGTPQQRGPSEGAQARREVSAAADTAETTRGWRPARRETPARAGLWGAGRGRRTRRLRRRGPAPVSRPTPCFCGGGTSCMWSRSV